MKHPRLSEVAQNFNTETAMKTGTLVAKIADDFINGNISDVKKDLAKLKGHKAALVAISVYNALPYGTQERAPKERAAFKRLLDSWVGDE